MDVDSVLDDLEETYEQLVETYGRVAAWRWYWSQAFRSIPTFFILSFSWSLVMLKNYLKIAIRNLRKQIGFSFINIFSLSIGIAFCALIFLFVRDELTFDHFHEFKDRIYMVEGEVYDADGSFSFSYDAHPLPLGQDLKSDIPEIEDFVRIGEGPHFIRSSGEAIEETILYVDPQFLTVFSFPLLHGEPSVALTGRNSIVITEDSATKYFGSIDVIGETIQVRLLDTFVDFTVGGVAENVPGNSTIQWDFLVPFERALETEDYLGAPEIATSYRYIMVYTYVLMSETAPDASASAKMADFYAQHYPSRRASDERSRTLGFKPITDVHLTNYSSLDYSYILSGIALAILLIACINFMTLAIGRSSGRSKEVSIRKVVGAQRRQLIAQFWGEAILLSILSLVLAVLLAELVLPVFNSLADKQLQFDYARDWTTLAGMVALVVFAGIVGGSYPALVLSGFTPIEALQNRLRLGGSNAFTKTLVVVQFSLSVFLIVGTMVMWSQLDYVRNQDPGFKKDQVVVIPVSGLDARDVADQFRTRIGGHASIDEVTATSNTMGNNRTSGQMITFEDVQHLVGIFKVETNYIDFMGLDLVEGRNFDPALASDSTESIIVNEALVRVFKMDDPIGKTIPEYYADSEPTIIGVVRDHNFQSFYQDIQSMVLTLDPGFDYEYVFVRVSPTRIPESLDLLRSTWTSVAPQVPFEFTFLDDHMQTLYESDQRWGKIVGYASVFAILIACLGLFGLSALSVHARTKEIGIRKVLGSSVSGIAMLLSREFVWLVLAGIAIASPVAWYVMQNWLDNFAFRIEIGPGLFVLTGVLAVTLAVATVSYQSIRAALTDPVESIRCE